MGKKGIILWAAAGLLMSAVLTGCGPMGQIRNVVNSSGDGKIEEETAKEDVGSMNNDDDHIAGEEEDAAPAVPVLGADNGQGYDGFEYLYEEILTSHMEEEEESGRIKRKAVIVYIPKGEDSGINNDLPGTAYADTMGVSFYFSLNPYEIDEKEKRPLEKKLEDYVTGIYNGGVEEGAYGTALEDMEISGVRKLENDAASITVKYCFFDQWEQEYSVFYNIYYLRQLEPDLLALLKIEIDSREATAKTPELLEEIEAFYEVDLEWDSKEAQKKLDNYLADIEKNGRVFGTLKFRFPAGWEIDGDYSDYEKTIYAPGGDSDGAGCGIGIISVYAGGEAEELMGWLGGEEDMQGYVQEAMGELDEFSLQKAEDCGETYIGKTMMMEFVYSEEGEMAACRMYLGGKDGYIYIIVAMQYQWLEMNTFDVAEELIEDGTADG
ncbi:MAG TPA: hypothetical protein DCZ40_14770 [Lachnospiraceae bacterium]|nr:hypothetical protein [Lachnospiraceae bacterium]